MFFHPIPCSYENGAPYWMVLLEAVFNMNGGRIFFMSVFYISVGFRCGWPASLWIIWICLRIGYSKSPMIHHDSSNNSSWFIIILRHTPWFSWLFMHFWPFCARKNGADPLQRCRPRWRASDVRSSSFIRSESDILGTLGETWTKDPGGLEHFFLVNLWLIYG